MPYWSSSRVGALPVGQTSTSSSKRSERHSKRKGITMEDLKKQTALRLAQEQGGDGVDPKLINQPPPHGTSYVATPERFQQPHSPYREPPRFYSSQAPYNTRTPPPQAPAVPAFSASESVDSAPQGSTSKLPHGLTVHELKEMTKARLASEKPVPQTVQVQQLPQRTSPSFNRHNLSRSPFPLEEAWESASVSTSASDYPASESFSGIHSNSFNGDDIVPFSRSSSYPNHEWQEPSLQQFPQSFYVPNRRRAATLSPRPGLTFLHEDRPMDHVPHLSHDFSTGMTGQLPHRSSSLVPEALTYGMVNTGSTIMQPNSNRTRALSAAASFPDPNCSQTHSATSLPTMSHTSEEFTLDKRELSNIFSSQIGSSNNDAIGGSIVTGLSDVFRESPIPNFNSYSSSALSSTTDSNPASLQVLGGGSSLASVGSSFGAESTELRMRSITEEFRGSTLGCNDLNSLISNGTSGLDARMRASTWAQGDVFGGVDHMSEDLASILKLSGAEQKDDIFSAP